MKRAHLQIRNRVCLFLTAFQNINIYSKGTYLIKVEASIDNISCGIWRKEGKGQNLIQPEPKHQSSKGFMIKYQNQKVDLNELFVIQTPSYRTYKESNIIVKLSLVKAGAEDKGKGKQQFTQLVSTTVIIRFIKNSTFQLTECHFHQPFSSNVSLIILSQPTKLSIDLKHYKHANKQQLMILKKQIKRLRYNNYLLSNKFKKIIYNSNEYLFTLPRLFVNGEKDISQTPCSEQKLIEYLLIYQNIELTPQTMNHELISIGLMNQQMQNVLYQGCVSGTVFVNKLKMDYEDKQSKRYRQYITRQEYKDKYCSNYKEIMKEKMKILERQYKIANQDGQLNNLIITNEIESEIPFSLPPFPIIVHEIQRRKSITNNNAPTNKLRYIFLLGHGYQGCTEDLLFIANALKRKFKKSKYLILKSYQSKMESSLLDMCKIAAQQVREYLSSFNFQEKDYRIVMMGHSMGGLILRWVAHTISQPLYGFVSLGTPHLGYLQGIKFFIKAGFSFLSGNSTCLSELSSRDSHDLHECLIFKLSSTATLSRFKKVILLSSLSDKYVSWHSARLQCYSKDPLKQQNFIEKEMINNIIGKDNQIQRIDRIEVQFKSSQNNVDKFIGRSSHIKFLNDENFLELFVNGCLSATLEE